MKELVIQNVGKRFASATVLDDITLTIPQGRLVCFLGPSGCGKTTLLRIIAGLEHATSGSVHFGDEDITDMAANQRDFGMVFQSLALFPHLSVADNIAYPLRLREKRGAKSGVQGDPQGSAQGQALGKSGIARRVTEMLELIQLPHMANRSISQLSGGQRQRVAIARAIASAPRLLLLDEPLSALDAKLREAMQIEIRQLQQRLGITMILVTHDQREAMTMADDIVVMERGRIAQFGKPLDIYREPVSEFVADFIGLGNIVPVTRESDGHVRLPGGALIAMSPVHAMSYAGAQSDMDADTAAAVRLLIRPEDIAVRTDCTNAGQNRLPGTIAFIRDVGASLEATIDCAGFSLTATTTARDTPGLVVGMPVLAELRADACRLVAARAV